MNRSAKKSGYTLLEMLIVLAVLAALAAMTVPAMRGPLDKSRLRGASRQVKAALAKARFFSIRQGKQIEFRYQLNGNGWVIQAPVQQAAVDENESLESDENSTPSGLSVESTDNNPDLPGSSDLPDDLPEGDDARSGLKQNLILRQGELPATISFVELPEEDQSESFENFAEFLSEKPAADSNEIEMNDSGEPVVWSEPILFLPNGRTEDRTIRLSGPRNFYVDLEIRGLTGVISYTAPFRLQPAEETSVQPLENSESGEGGEEIE